MHNPRSITDFEYKIPKYKNRKPLEKSQKLGIIQGVLQAFNEKFQNKKQVPPFIVIKVLRFYTMYISSIDGVAQA